MCVYVYICRGDAILKRKACMGPGVGAQRRGPVPKRMSDEKTIMTALAPLVIRAHPHHGGLQDVGQLNQEGEDRCRIQGSLVGSEGIRFLMGPRFLPFHGVFHAHPGPYSVYLRHDCQRSQLHGVPAPFALGHQRCEAFCHSFRLPSRGLHRAQEVRQPVPEDPGQPFEHHD